MQNPKFAVSLETRVIQWISLTIRAISPMMCLHFTWDKHALNPERMKIPTVAFQSRICSSNIAYFHSAHYTSTGNKPGTVSFLLSPFPKRTRNHCNVYMEDHQFQAMSYAEENMVNIGMDVWVLLKVGIWMYWSGYQSKIFLGILMC